MVARLDGYVGEVLNLLDELGLEDNTLVVFTSDNGAQSGGKDSGWTKMTDFFKANGDLRGYKGSYYEGGLRVPFLVRWPGRIKAGSTSDHILAFWDVLPTLCDVAGIQKPAGLDGISVLPTLTGAGEQDEHLGLYWEYPLARAAGISRAARMGRWKAIQMRPVGPVELYDLEADPSETQNVAGEHPALVREMTEFMGGAHEPLRDYPQVGPATGINDYVR
jgi:arylsulfatase A-like enzyme